VDYTQASSTAAFQCNVAMKMVSLVKAKPQDIARSIVAHLPPFELISKVFTL
jgi:arginyl-tRNA synthetase